MDDLNEMLEQMVMDYLGYGINDDVVEEESAL